MAQCKASTKKGQRCRNASQKELKGYCRLHKPKVRLQKVIKFLGGAGKSAGPIWSVIQIINFVYQHIDEIKEYFSQISHEYNQWVLDERPYDMKTASRIKDEYLELAEKNNISDEQVNVLSERFELWFDNLPEHMKTKIYQWAKEYKQQ